MVGSEKVIETLYQRGCESLGELNVDRSVFERFAKRALAANGNNVDAVPAEDLYLACACSEGSSTAIELFERRYTAVLNKVAARAQGAGVDREELLQQVRVRLFVGDGSIATYLGRGPLGGWLRVVAARIASELIQRDAPVRPASMGLRETWSNVAVASDDVELTTMRSELRTHFEVALEQAAQEMSSTDRALLRQFYVHRVGIDGIAKLLGVHRSNASRAVARARGDFLRRVKQTLGVALRLSDTALDSAFGLMRSDLALNLGTVLQSSK